MSSVIIHGHFYQPPRENPWTGAIDPEESARPFHDWNERICAECYRPNAFARIVDGRGRVERIVNNYVGISFNFGPTLLAWLEHASPETYARILAADRESLRMHGGHGNAIAQAYNHAILPLCNPRDRRTQVLWGIADFRHRFGREPEAMWLPETACNDDTLATLIEAGMKYVILSPFQAERVRLLVGGEWRSVAGGSIDPRMPYRYFHRDGSGRAIAIFFYDAAAARAVAFEGALASSQNLLDRLERARGSLGALVNVATDGESYGHYSRFGDRSLAYTLAAEAPARGLHVTNYGEFLDQHPPTEEVEIKPAPNGEGTSWSCAHGVGRWYRDCGCSTGAREGWNQAWRGPLRAAFDALRETAAQCFEELGGYLVRDPWGARDAYIELVLDRTKDREAFVNRLAGGRRLRGTHRARMFRLLEMQRNAMLMYTSCGWFFADISGLETIQVMKYAGRTLDLMAELGATPPEGAFLDQLAEATSNLPEMGNGADIYRRFVPPCRATPKRIAAHLAISALANHGAERGALGDYAYRKQYHRREQHGRLTLAISRLALKATLSAEEYDYAVAALHLGGLDFYCALQAYPGAARFKQSAQELWKNLRGAFLPKMLRMMQEHFGPEEFGLEDVLADGHRVVCEMVFGDLLEGFTAQFGRLYDEYARVAEMLQEAGFELPRAFRQVAEFTLGLRLEDETVRQRGNSNPHAYDKALAIAQQVARRGYVIDHTATNAAFSTMITRAVNDAASDRTLEKTRSALEFVFLAHKLGLQPNLDAAQEAVYAVLTENPVGSTEFGELAAALGLASTAPQPSTKTTSRASTARDTAGLTFAPEPQTRSNQG